MKKQLTFALATAMLFLSTFSLNAQINTPSASPAAMFKQTVGLTDIEVEYYRPGKKGRVIFAEDGLVPYGKMWRTGANASTKISFSDDVTFGGVEVPAGKYALYTIPGASSWTIVLYKDLSHWGVPREYDESQEAARFKVEAGMMDNVKETFTMGIGDISTDMANLYLAWDKTKVLIPVKVEVDSKVMADIEAAMGGPSAREYYLSASYFHDNDKDLNQALTWIKKANEMDPQYWTLRREALILADMGRYGQAIAVAEKSKTAAMEAGNANYVSMNEKSIAEWKEMKGSGGSSKGGKKASKEAKS